MEPRKLKLIWLTIVLFISVGVQWKWKTANIPAHLLHHPMAFHENFVSEKLGKELLSLVESVKNFPTNANDLVYYNRTYEHIGEVEKRLENGECPSSYLVPNKDGTKCVFPGRFDVAYHYMKFGGIDGLKERYETLASRMQSFGRYIFELDKYPVMKEIFTSQKFLKDAKEVCPKNKQILDPFQYHLIIQVPGQVVPVHLDAPLFTDASRFQYPVWLLVAMTGSGLYKEKFVDQIQVVINLHEWNNTKLGGQFAYYPNNTVKPIFVQPLPRSATIMDGAKTIHATNLYKPKVKPPMLPKNAFNVLEYIGDDVWIVKSDDNEIAT
uniref:Uncharacterized protein n=1 Tax=Panagrolaimus sp. PS1159 TaxID=55785 RepID=A0AC35F934_9BILA